MLGRRQIDDSVQLPASPLVRHEAASLWPPLRTDLTTAESPGSSQTAPHLRLSNGFLYGSLLP